MRSKPGEEQAVATPTPTPSPTPYPNPLPLPPTWLKMSTRWPPVCMRLSSLSSSSTLPRVRGRVKMRVRGGLKIGVRGRVGG